MATSIIQVRVDDKLKAEATALYEKLGIDLSTAMRMFLKRSVSVNGIPFSMVLPTEPYDIQAAKSALNEIHEAALQSGVSDMTLEEINAEIDSYRKERKARGNA